jgi:enamine deaminase RidA (YjgF/YER057c/UK114 family)
MVKAVSEYLKGAAEVPHHRTLVMVGAQSPVGPGGKVSGDIAEQCAMVWSKITDALAEKNLEPRHIVALDIDLADRAHHDAVMAEQARHIRHHIAQSTRVVGLLDESWMVQIAVVAAVTR